MYCINHPGFEQLNTIENPLLKKGIFLAGNIGSGKTMLMEILRQCAFPGHIHGIKTCREISQLFAAEGFLVIQRFGTKAVRREHGQIKMNATFFDDLGAEKDMNHYGNKMNVMGEIILDRYDNYRKHGLKTHITTNLDLNEIEEYYGNRVLSRMYEMFNFITLGGNKDAKDRRIHH